jgi:hypothetical protein
MLTELKDKDGLSEGVPFPTINESLRVTLQPFPSLGILKVMTSVPNLACIPIYGAPSQRLNHELMEHELSVSLKR